MTGVPICVPDHAGRRRLQGGLGATQMDVVYIILCDDDCGALLETVTAITQDPYGGAAVAASIIEQVEVAAEAAGLPPGAVLSTPEVNSAYAATTWLLAHTRQAAHASTDAPSCTLSPLRSRQRAHAHTASPRLL